MLKNLQKYTLLGTLLLMPSVSFAASGFCSAISGIKLPSSPKLADIFNFFTCLLENAVVPLLITTAIVIFIWGVVQFIGNADNEEKRKKGREFMIWAVISLFMIVSVWGIVHILTNTFGVSFGLPQLAQ